MQPAPDMGETSVIVQCGQASIFQHFVDVSQYMFFLVVVSSFFLLLFPVHYFLVIYC